MSYAEIQYAVSGDAICRMQRAICRMQRAICCMQRAICRIRLYLNFEIDSEIMLNKHNYTKLIWRENTDHMTITCVMFCEKDGGERHS